MRTSALVSMLAGAALCGCSAEQIDTTYQSYRVRLWGPDAARAPAGSAADPFAVTREYEVKLRLWEDAAGTVPYGSRLKQEELAEEFAGFRPEIVFVRRATSEGPALLGPDGETPALPRLRENQAALFVSAQVIGLDDDRRPIARARCPVVALQVSSGAAPFVECRAFYGFIGRWNPLPSPALSRHSFAAAALSDGRILVAGGRSSHPEVTTPLGTVEVFEPFAEKGLGRWRELGLLQSARFDLSGTVNDRGEVLFTGGRTSDATNASKDVDWFDPSGDGRLRVLTNGLSVGRYGHAVGWTGGEGVVVAGGSLSTTQRLSTTEFVSPRTRYNVEDAAPQSRVGACFATVRKDLMLLCGGGEKGCQTYDFAAAAFSAAGASSFARTDVKCETVGGAVVLVGGSTRADETAIETWREGSSGPSFLANAPWAVTEHAMAVANGKVVVAGGRIPGTADSLRTGFWFDPAAPGTVHEMVRDGAEMSIGRVGHQLVGLRDGTVVALGGKLKSGFSGEVGVEAFVVPDE